MKMESCKICGEGFEKVHSQMRYCSDECRRIGHRKSWREFGERNRETKREYHARYYAKHSAEVINRTRAYQKTDMGKAATAKSGQRQKLINPEKVSARQAVADALRAGKLVKRPCAKCDDPNAEAHHPDYSKPLYVVWLCSLHHREIHGRLVTQ